MNSSKRYFIIAGLMLAATVIATAIIFPHLPDVVPTHWDLQDHPNRFGSKWVDVLIMPCVMLAMLGLMAALPWLSPKNFEVGPRPVYLQIMLLVLLLMAAIHFQILAAALGAHFNIGRFLMIAISAMFAAMGFLLPNLRRNFYVGVRTPWTLASDRVWQATHHFAGRVFLIGGMLALLCALVFRPPYWPAISIIVLTGIAPVIHSLVYYKQLEHRGQV